MSLESLSIFGDWKEPFFVLTEFVLRSIAFAWYAPILCDQALVSSQAEHQSSLVAPLPASYEKVNSSHKRRAIAISLGKLQPNQ